MTPKGQVKKDIKDVLKALKMFFWMPPMTIYGKTGVSDFIVLYRGRALFIEAKAKVSSEWTPNQQRFSREVPTLEILSDMVNCEYRELRAILGLNAEDLTR